MVSWGEGGNILTSIYFKWQLPDMKLTMEYFYKASCDLFTWPDQPFASGQVKSQVFIHHRKCWSCPGNMCSLEKIRNLSYRPLPYRKHRRMKQTYDSGVPAAWLWENVTHNNIVWLLWLPMLLPFVKYIILRSIRVRVAGWWGSSCWHTVWHFNHASTVLFAT